MKIKEIITELKLDLSSSDKETSGVLNTKQLDIIGTGVQAIVYSHKTKPNTIIKIAAVSGNDDPICQFLRVCQNHPENPFFPKVSKAKILKLKPFSQDDLEYLEDRFGKEIDELPIHEKRGRQVIIVTEKLSEISDNTLIMKIEELGLTDVVKEYRIPRMLKRFDIAFNQAFNIPEGRRKMINATTNPAFAKALRIMEPLFAFNLFQPDMHRGNFMLRGDQLVINDPIATRMDDLD